MIAGVLYLYFAAQGTMQFDPWVCAGLLLFDAMVWSAIRGD